ncbi:hypothetical protein [Zunongwangia sp. HRR-M8]|uniref:hypothetical protein n=1 Tax=Zunongwangia sp. HRR-M8 TaxID=3015170 RepID=UPI0022DD7677|nr:hypothetical protein [Zunongwangia sp. HRR-M8]WBL22014.1 hypothetical protein PBT89_15030 [Zunongwangia sp. HRR-M8]
MEKSIENIWKEGFEAEKKLSAPVVSNLYRKKSLLVVNKINSTMKRDNLSLIPMLIVFFAVFVYLDKMILGCYIGLLLIVLFFLNRRILKRFEAIDIKSNTYTYLLNYRNQIKRSIRFSTWIVGLGFPLLILPSYWMFFEGTQMMESFEQLSFSFQLLLTLGIAITLSVLCVAMYKLANIVLYGRLLANLESTLDDMEQLMDS